MSFIPGLSPVRRARTPGYPVTPVNKRPKPSFASPSRSCTMEHADMARNLRETSGALSSMASLLFDRIQLSDVLAAQRSPARGPAVVSSSTSTTSALPTSPAAGHHPEPHYPCPPPQMPCHAVQVPLPACQPLHRMPCGDVVDNHGHLVKGAKRSVQEAVDEMMKEFHRRMGSRGK